MKLLREPVVLEKVGVGKTKFKTDYVDTGRARWIYSGRTKRMPEHEVDRLIAEDIVKADAENAPVKPALRREHSLKGTRISVARRRRTKPTPPIEDEAAPAGS